MKNRIKIKAARTALAAELGCTRETLQRWANKANVDLDNLYLRDVLKLVRGEEYRSEAHTIAACAK